jgi:hypothetical protein
MRIYYHYIFLRTTLVYWSFSLILFQIQLVVWQISVVSGLYHHLVIIYKTTLMILENEWIFTFFIILLCFFLSWRIPCTNKRVLILWNVLLCLSWIYYCWQFLKQWCKGRLFSLLLQIFDFQEEFTENHIAFLFASFSGDSLYYQLF